MYIVLISDSSYERAWNVLQAKLNGRRYDQMTESEGEGKKGKKIIPKPIAARSARKIARATATAALAAAEEGGEVHCGRRIHFLSS